MSNLDALKREGVAWVQLLVSGAATPDDARALEQWCARSPRHREAFAEASRVWSDIGPAAELLRAGSRPAVGLAPSPFEPVRPRYRPARRAVLGGGLAAAAAWTIVRPPLGLWPSLSELNADYRTGTGEQRQVTVAADVAVTLNTQTSIALETPVAGVPCVRLIAGEATFSAPRGTLVVAADRGRAVATRARLDVRQLSTPSPAVCVSCLDGEVAIEFGGRSAALAAGQQARYGRGGLSEIVTVDPDIVLAWQRGIVVFRATPLAEVIEEVNRYRPGRIVLVNSALADRPVSGRFRTDRMDLILTRLEQATGARITPLPGGLALVS